MDTLANHASLPPQALLDALAESDADLAAGRVVSGMALKKRLDKAIERQATAPRLASNRDI